MSPKVIENGAGQWAIIYHFLLVVCKNNISILRRFKILSLLQYTWLPGNPCYNATLC